MHFYPPDNCFIPFKLNMDNVSICLIASALIKGTMTVFVSFDSLVIFHDIQLDSAETQEANSSAISECAYLPPYCPDFDTIPTA